MKKIYYGIGLTLLIISLICIFETINLSNIQKKIIDADSIQINHFINIAECSEEFMENYFNEYNKIQDNYDKENMLIVTSEKNLTTENTYGAKKIIEAPNNQYILVYDSTETKNTALKEISNSNEIEYVEENIVYSACGTYNSWGIEKTGLDNAIKIANNKNLDDITVAIIDTGCDIELLNKNFNNKIDESYNVLFPYLDIDDTEGHGTHIAGTIAEGTPSNVKIFPVKVATSRTLYNIDVLTAINYIVYYKKANVINMSFASYSSSNALHTAIKAATEENIICVAAAGNENTSNQAYPAAYNETLSISACDSNLERASFSNYGSTIDFTAPGVNIISINKNMNGTSMATPHVASAVAILKSYNKEYTLEEIKEILKTYALDLGMEGRDEDFGYGLIDFSNIEYCECTCQKCDNIYYCKDCNCDICKFDKNNKIQLEKIAVENTNPINYESITNLHKLNVVLYYSNGDIRSVELEDIIDKCDIDYQTDYTSYIFGTIKYMDKTANFSFNLAKTDSIWKYEKINETSIKITGINQYYTERLSIPETIDGYPVTEIGEKAFYKNEICKIILPKTLKKIGNSAFANSEVIEEIVIPEGLEKIGNNAFSYCTKLKKITLPESLKDLGYGTFDNCHSLEEIYIPSKIWNITGYEFSNCFSLKKIEVSPENKWYDSRKNCNAIINTENNSLVVGCINTNIPDSVETIESGSFYGRLGLKALTIPEGVKTLQNGAICSCQNLKEITLPRSLENIDDVFIVNIYNYDELIFLVHRESVAHNYVKKRNLKYRCLDTIIKVNYPENKQHIAFEKIDKNYLSIDIYNDERDYKNHIKETITSGINVKYNFADSLRYKDTYCIVSGYRQNGEYIREILPLKVLKATPQYTIPSDLTADIGQKLSEISLPKGFSWMNDNDLIAKDVSIYYAKYEQQDLENYEIVENIEIPVSIINSNPEIIPEVTPEIVPEVTPEILYQTHIQNIGWQNYVSNGQMSGTQGKSLRLEAINIKLNNFGYSGEIQYRTHIQNIGWEKEWKSNGEISGTHGQSLRLEAIQIKLTEEMAEQFDVYYRVHVQEFGWLDWAKNGASSGSAGYSYRLEGIEILLIKKGESAPGPALKTFISAKKISYRTHVQDVGWQNYVSDGAMSGTEGKSLRLEGIIIDLQNQEYFGNIEYRTHIQNIGWENTWKSHGMMSGTSGQSLRLEAIQIKLTGEISNYYDIYYRVHAQEFGWLDWAKNGQSAGTAGYSYRLEGIQIVLVEKNTPAPGSTINPFYSV